MAETVADFMLSRLSQWGVQRIYGYPGDGINGILGALDRAMDRFQFVQVRHEEEAASWLPRMPNSQARREFASPLRAPEQFIF